MRNSIVNVFARLRQDEKGVTLVEYGIALVLAITDRRDPWDAETTVEGAATFRASVGLKAQ